MDKDEHKLKYILHVSLVNIDTGKARDLNAFMSNKLFNEEILMGYIEKAINDYFELDSDIKKLDDF